MWTRKCLELVHFLVLQRQNRDLVGQTFPHALLNYKNNCLGHRAIVMLYCKHKEICQTLILIICE